MNKQVQLFSLTSTQIGKVNNKFDFRLLFISLLAAALGHIAVRPSKRIKFQQASFACKLSLLFGLVVKTTQAAKCYDDIKLPTRVL